VPVLAWNPGFCQDPERFKWADPSIPTTSVPYFDMRCGRTFTDFPDFERNLPQFLDSNDRDEYRSRDYVLENLTLERSSKHFVEILEEKLR
jgi:hypothetical protein